MKKHLIKKTVLSGVLALLSYSYADDAQLFGELNSAYRSGAFPGVVEYAVQLENEYPRSVLLGRALSLKGESLFKLGRCDEAVPVLERAIPLCKNDTELLLSSYLYAGKSSAFLLENTKALNFFYDALKINTDTLSDKEKQLRFLCETEAARIFYDSEDYKNAVLLLEDAVNNGSYFSKADNDRNILMLFDSYLKLKKYSRLISVSKNLNREITDEDTYASLRLDTGMAYEESGNYKSAYSEYVYVLENCDASYASLALQKAYNVASLHRAQVGEEPGRVLEHAKENLAGYDSLLAEFWTRLAVDCYEAEDFARSRSYFKNAEENDSTHEYSLLTGIYLSKMAPSAKLLILESYGKRSDEPEKKLCYEEWLCECAKNALLEKSYEKCIALSEQVLPLLKNDSSKKALYNDALYYYALSLFKTENKDKAYDIFATAETSSKESELLKAHLFSYRKKYSEASKLYEKNNSQLSPEERADYAKVLFYEGKILSSYKEALRSDTPQGTYMAALSSFNKKDWKNADFYFRKYLSSKDSKNADYALFYSGYAQYKTGQSLSAYNTLNQFVKKYPLHQLAWNAHITCASCAVQNSNYEDAAFHAKKAVEVSSTVTQKQDAVLLCAEIYVDAEKYDEALKILSASAREKSDFGVLARYQSALIYARKGDLLQSDRMYAEIQNSFSSNPLADESSYRRGELYYTAANYESAVSRFNEYQKKFPSGKFKDASYFYMADSYAHLSQNDRAQLFYSNLLKTFPESSYAYGAKKNLVAIYKKDGDYKKSYELACELVSQFSTEAKKDGFYSEVEELRQLSGGVNSDYLSFKKEYESLGESSTAEGRAKGTELCEFMEKDASMKADAVILAQELFALQSKNDEESAWACRTGVIYAEDLRSRNLNKKAADVFLKTAAFAMNVRNALITQRSLYGAAECYMSNGLEGDARAVADKLHELYPGSKYDLNCQKLFK
ncbi:MAG: tetratricopeptide repeat protein [Treponema sp.]|nr:tetratricopeptide repeat protein [Treponema sp.]